MKKGNLAEIFAAMTEDKIHPIDIRAVVGSKMPGMARYIPAFVYRMLGNLIALDDINAFIAAYGDRNGVDFADAVIEYLNVSFDVSGEENLPRESERCIFVSNHPFGGPDGIALISYLGKCYSEIKFPVNDFLMNLRNLNGIFLPVNKHGSFGRDAALALEQAYASDCQMIMFPAGLCSRKQHGVVRDTDWKKHFVSKAWQYGRVVVPIRIFGENSPFFYNLALWRKRLGIPVNIEQLLLPRETFKKRNGKFSIKIGKPLSAEELREISSSPSCVAAELRRRIYEF